MLSPLSAIRVARDVPSRCLGRQQWKATSGEGGLYLDAVVELDQGKGGSSWLGKADPCTRGFERALHPKLTQHPDMLITECAISSLVHGGAAGFRHAEIKYP